MAATLSPLELDGKSAQSKNAEPASIRTFTSYAFDRNILVPASPFRFTAPGVDIDTRLALRSGDFTTLWVTPPGGVRQQVGTGIIDETDTHATSENVEYLLTGRDMMGQLVDNSAVDASNRIINLTGVTLGGILKSLIQNTRIPATFDSQQVPTGTLLFQTNAGETKINALQRYLEPANCLIWSKPNGQLVLGKPNFYQPRSGFLVLNRSSPVGNNVIDMRCRRNVNTAIRQIVCQLQDMNQVDAGQFTVNCNDADMLEVAPALVGRSVYTNFTYGNGADAYNQLTQVGNQPGNPKAMGHAYAMRQIARENMKIIDIEAVIRNHVNEDGVAYNVDQIYNVQFEDEDVSEDMYVYSCTYELTDKQGMLTRLRLCRKGTICAYAAALNKASA